MVALSIISFKIIKDLRIFIQEVKKCYIVLLVVVIGGENIFSKAIAIKQALKIVKVAFMREQLFYHSQFF